MMIETKVYEDYEMKILHQYNDSERWFSRQRKLLQKEGFKYKESKIHDQEGYIAHFFIKTKEEEKE